MGAVSNNTTYCQNFQAMTIHAQPSVNKDEFMSFFRDEKKIQQLTREDKAEIARHILQGFTHLNREEFEEIWNDYSAAIHQIVEERNSLPVF